MSDQKRDQVEAMKAKLSEGLEQLEDLDIDELSDEDLEAVAGGEICGCSCWCCSAVKADDEVSDAEGSE